MRGRIKKFIALVMSLLIMNQLPGFDLIISKAASEYIYIDTSVTADSEDTYVFYSGGCTLDVASGITVSEVSVTGPNTYVVENGGTINSVTSSNGTLNLNGGSYGTISTSQVAEGSGVIFNGITASAVTANGPIQFNGNNTVSSLTAAEEITGTGAVTVSSYLSVPGSTATIYVDKETQISTLNSDVTVYYDGTAYSIPANSTDTTLLLEYGTRVSFGPVDSYVTWSSEDGKLDTPLLVGESIGTYQCTVAEGYYFPEGYTVTTTGNATPAVTRIDESEIQVSYTIADTDSGEVIITFPTPNELEIGTGILTITDVKVGDSWDATVESETNSTAHDGIMYKVKGTNDATYTTQAPTKAGDYVARVILPATGIYKELTITDEFNISKKLGEGTLSVADVTSGDSMIIEISSGTHEKTTAVMEYKVTGADDSTYSTTEPTEAGNYTARATLAENDTFEQLILTDEFTVIEKVVEPEDTEEVITKLDGSAVLTVVDSYYGMTIKPQLTSPTNPTAGVVVEYKSYGAGDETYTKTVPNDIGRYIARVKLPENDKYKAMVLTDEFTISYLPVPQDAYSLVGEIGSNGYYVSDVTVVAKDGYAVSNSLNGEYVEQFTLRASTSSRTLYFMDVDTGAKSEGIVMAVVNIDRESPNIDADNNKTYYADSLAISISDTNLASILVNGENVDIDGNRAMLDLKSDGGVEEYDIVVTDIAGNVRTMKVTVAAEWTKSGEIPSGSPIKLEPGKNYILGDGSWTVSGDSTTYSGGSSFYVGSDGKYTFNKQ